MDSQLKKGILDACVLKYLSINPSYGYKMIEDISKYIEISESTLYPILKRLELANYLEIYKEEHNGRLRKYYKITDLGLEKLNDYKVQWRDLDKVIKYVVGGKE